MASDSGTYFESAGAKLQHCTDKYYNVNINTTGGVDGISLNKIQKANVSTGGYRYRNFRGTSWNFQVMVGTGKTGDIVIGTKTYPVENAKVSPLGYRISWRADRGPTSSFVEIGKLPNMNFTGGDN